MECPGCAAVLSLWLLSSWTHFCEHKTLFWSAHNPADGSIWFLIPLYHLLRHKVDEMLPKVSLLTSVTSKSDSINFAFRTHTFHCVISYLKTCNDCPPPSFSFCHQSFSNPCTPLFWSSFNSFLCSWELVAACMHLFTLCPSSYVPIPLSSCLICLANSYSVFLGVGPVSLPLWVFSWQCISTPSPSSSSQPHLHIGPSSSVCWCNDGYLLKYSSILLFRTDTKLTLTIAQ